MTIFFPQGQHTKAHKMILCACSPYFKNLLEQNPAKHPIIILKDVPFAHLTAILEFMYAGEVNVAQVNFFSGEGSLILASSVYFAVTHADFLLPPGAIACLPEDCREAADQGSG